MTDLKACREAFEMWAEEEDIPTTLGNYGAYLLTETAYAWEIWQAAWNTRANEGGEAVHVNGIEDARDAKLRALRNRFIRERTVTWQREGFEYEVARAKAEADLNEYEQAFRPIRPARGG